MVSGTKEHRIRARHAGKVTNIYTLHCTDSKCFPLWYQTVWVSRSLTEEIHLACARTHGMDEALEIELRDEEGVAPTFRGIWSHVKY